MEWQWKNDMKNWVDSPSRAVWKNRTEYMWWVLSEVKWKVLCSWMGWGEWRDGMDHLHAHRGQYGRIGYIWWLEGELK